MSKHNPFRVQFTRENPARPLVYSQPLGSGSIWYTQGYDPNGQYHVDIAYSLPDAFATAESWATNGYPTKAAA